MPHAIAVHLSQLAIVPFLVRETNETEVPHELARALSSPPAAQTLDADEDGVLSLFDLYITVARNVAQSYLEGELICIEHPLLDDNGDGKGVEVQLDFLTPDQGGRPRPRAWTPPKIPRTADGGYARTIVLPLERAAAESEPPAASRGMSGTLAQRRTSVSLVHNAI